jgi:ATP-dependent DNA ligase
MDRGRVSLVSRRGNYLRGYVPAFPGSLERTSHPLFSTGRSSVPERRASFEALQGVMGHRVGVEDVAFLAFDLLWLGGRSLQRMPYDERREERSTPTPRTDVHGPR